MDGLQGVQECEFRSLLKWQPVELLKDGGDVMYEGV